MSGPKSSRYTLTAEQLRKILEEQERIRKELEEAARKERECKEAKEYLSNTENKAKRYVNIVKEYEQKAISAKIPISGEISDKLQMFYSKSNQLKSICQAKTNDKYETLMNIRKQAETLYNEIASNQEKLIDKIKKKITEYRIQMDSEMAEGMKVSFAYVGASEEPFDAVDDDTITQLEEMLLLNLSKELNNEITEAIERYRKIEDPNIKSNFSSVTAESLKKRCLAFKKFIDDNSEKFAKMFDRYSALCKQLNIKEEAFVFSEEGMNELNEIIKTYEQRLQQEEEQTYISRSVDEVMREMGYEVIGQRKVQKKSGKTFKSKLLTYEDGTVINITESPFGQITMEVGGIYDNDRLPDVNERVALQKTMESFCRDFKEIEHRLSQRGVVLNSRLSMAPPEEAYAQIINYSDYDLVDGFNIAASKKKKDSEKEKKQIRNDERNGKI